MPSPNPERHLARKPNISFSIYSHICPVEPPRACGMRGRRRGERWQYSMLSFHHRYRLYSPIYMPRVDVTPCECREYPDLTESILRAVSMSAISSSKAFFTLSWVAITDGVTFAQKSTARLGLSGSVMSKAVNGSSRPQPR